MKTNLKQLFNHTTIMPFKWKSNYVCYYCSETFSEYDKFREHTKSHTKKALNSLKICREVMIDVSEIFCELCKSEFKSRSLVVDHLIQSHRKVFFKNVSIAFQEYRLIDLRCRICEQQFSSFEMLTSHVRACVWKGGFECDNCGKWFTTAANISQHISTNHMSGFACVKCHKRFDTKTLLKYHRHQDLCARFHQCTQCDAKFVYAGSLKKHMAEKHSNDKCTTCKYCLNEVPSVTEMKLHVSSCEFKDQVKTNDNQLSNKKPRKRALCNQIRRNIQCVLNMSTAVPFKYKGKFFCFYCSQWFCNFVDLISHTRAEHPVCELKSKAMKSCKGEKAIIKLDIAGLACKLCHQPMSDLKSFIDHAISEHEADYDESVTFKCFETFTLTEDRTPCPVCQKPFAYFATLLNHLGAEHNHHKAVCDYCGRGFRTTTSLAIHISNSHTGACECSVCNAKCNNSAVLARHMARFHDAKDHKCSQCPELFETIYKKQCHLITAHNVGHKCMYCGKMFTRNSFMMNHVRRTHLKERTVACSVCHAKFFDGYHMKRHMVKHEGIRRFKCDICAKTFLRVRNLKSHMDTHKKNLQEGI